MNLAYPIKDIAEIDGVTYELDMSFDNILRLFDLIKDETINDVVKIETGMIMLINDDLDQYDIETKAQIFIDLFKSVIGEDEEEHQAVDIAGNPMPKMTSEDEKTHDLVQDRSEERRVGKEEKIIEAAEQGETKRRQKREMTRI